MSTVDQLLSMGLVSRDVALGPLTTYKAGGPARLFADIGSSEDLEELIGSGLTTDMDTLVLGRGSNLVVADTGFDGLVLRLSGEFVAVAVDGDQVTAGGATPLARVARVSVDHRLSGLEFFVGIPGSVGGAVRQNAGCFGAETRDRLVFAEVVDMRIGSRRVATPDALQLTYRHSNLQSHEVVVSASFRCVPGDPEEGRRQMRAVTRWRKEHQPGGTLNAGSVFKNPPHITAGELIDQLGLKGTRVGDVAVSDKHANFFVAGPDATARDIHRLVTEVRDTVLERTGTMLETEIQFVGFET